MNYSAIRPLAGLATQAEAARIGFSVEENVRRLLRIHWLERRLMYAMTAHLPATRVWEVKCALALHQWYAAQHVDALRTRIAELRNPVPSLEEAPDAPLNAFIEELLRSRDAVELVSGIYGVALPALRDAYSEHIARTNKLVDHATVRLMRTALTEVEEALAWGVTALAALVAGDSAARRRSDGWREHLTAWLDAAGGVCGFPRTGLPAPPPRSAAGEFVPDMHPMRDERFHGSYNFNFPPHLIYADERIPVAERNLSLICKRTLEMDVPEMMASFITERSDQPWEFHLDYSRQLWDEARHAMMGTVALADRGVDWTTIPLNVGFALRLNLHATPVERQIVLFAIEQSLMAGDVGKRAEYETAVAAGDDLSAHFQDYDWADEVLHAQIGRRALRREGISQSEAAARAREIHDRTWAELDQYKDRQPQEDWWPGFVLSALGVDSASDPGERLRAPSVLAE